MENINHPKLFLFLHYIKTIFREKEKNPIRYTLTNGTNIHDLICFEMNFSF